MLNERKRIDDDFERRTELRIHDGALSDQDIQLIGDVVVFEIRVMFL